ncbi:MAG: hypothetical protein U1F83_14300 [Verrucomicrobiota bacterium]
MKTTFTKNLGISEHSPASPHHKVAPDLERATPARIGFGLRQPFAAFPPQDNLCQSGRGLPQSKTLTRE